MANDQLRRSAVFEGYGQLSLQSLVHYLCSHDQLHLADLQWLLGKIEATRAQAQTNPSGERNVQGLAPLAVPHVKR